MLLRKKGFPQEDELVLCTVTAIHYSSVFAKLDDYEKSGMIHISEISPGRIRNIRDYVKEGKKIVCKVLRINKEKGHIDLSLRRVNEGQRRAKMDEIKQQQLSEKIIEFVAKQHKIKVEELFAEVSEKVLKKYPTLFIAFEDVVAGSITLEKLGIEKKIAADLTEAIKQRIKPVVHEIGGKLTLASFRRDGMPLIKEAVKKSKKPGITITYLGGGTYGVAIQGEDIKEAEKTLSSFVKDLTDFMEENDATAAFERAE